jgi:TRAP-type C4-dicarboxylate transport system substrate-binding protein
VRRRQFLTASTLVAGGLVAGSARTVFAGKPNRIILGGYGPSTSSFSQGLKHIGNRLEAEFGDEFEVRYAYNIMDLGYDGAGALTSLVNNGVLSLAYLTMFDGNPALQVAALPFLFPDSETARAAMDGALGQSAIDSIESGTNLRVLGFFENGFRHISNSVRPVREPDDLKGLTIRVLGVQKRTLDLLGANARVTPLPAVFGGLESGELHGQENPFENVVTYNLYNVQKYYTETAHSYLSPAVRDAVALQRRLHDQAEIDAAKVIRESGGEIAILTPQQRAAFVARVAPVYADARTKFSPELLSLVGL